MAKKSSKSVFRVLGLLVLIVLAVGGYWAYKNIFKSNVHLEQGKKYTYIYIHTGAQYQDVLDALYTDNIIDDHKSFEWTAKEMGLPEHVNPGKYRIGDDMSNRSLVKMLINAKQEKVKLYFNSQIRTREQFENYITDKLEIDAGELEEYLDDNSKLEELYGLNSENIMALVRPQTLEVNWNTSIDELFGKLKESFNAFWTKDRLAKAKATGYDVADVIVLGSIVQNESGIKSEQQKIAGVYINRLKQDMRLQADPTIVFANGNFDVQRVLNADKGIDSPYNTYKYKGLPPGPICLVSDQAIDAVLNYEKHNYTYFCANPDFSGYSRYTSDYKVHMKNAQAYQDALSKKGIKR
ncbi:MAG: endolytic transglycosylase MltG [Bacteroidetes bacterium]|nr:endolytic transglycosylase MltG [Bacteroidota bacterium]